MVLYTLELSAQQMLCPCENILILTGCQWAPATTHWVGILTEMYVIHMERYQKWSS